MPTYPLPGGRLSPGRGFTGPLPGHTGADLVHPDGTCARRVVAPISGVVTWAENLGGGHGLLVTNGPEQWGLWHLSGRLVRGGEKVNEGQPVATAGASGTRVQGCNLHVERKVNGQLTDPMPALGGEVDRPTRIEVEPGASCPPGYAKDPSGPNRCIRIGGDGGVVDLTDVPGAIANAAIGAALPVLSNLAILLVALLIGWAGVKQALGIGTR